MGRAARCGLADGEGRSDRDGEGMISGVSIAVAARTAAGYGAAVARTATGGREQGAVPRVRRGSAASGKAQRWRGRGI